MPDRIAYTTSTSSQHSTIPAAHFSMPAMSCAVPEKTMVEGHAREEPAEELHAETRALTENSFQGPSLRARASWPDAAGLHQGYSPPDQAGALGHSGWQPHERAERPPLPRPPAACEAQPPSSRQLPTPAHQQQCPPRQQSTSLVDLARITAGPNDTTTVTSLASAANLHVRRHSCGLPTVPPSPASALLEGEIADSRYVDSGGGGMVGGSGPDDRLHRRGASIQPWSSYPGAGSLLSGNNMTSAERESRGEDHCSAESYGAGGDPGAAPPSAWRQQTPDGQSCHQYPLSPSTLTSANERVRDAAADSSSGGGIFDLRAVDMGRRYQTGTPSWAASALRAVSGTERYRGNDPLPSTSSASPQGGRYGLAALSPSIAEEGEPAAAGIDAPLHSLRGHNPYRASYIAAAAAVEAVAIARLAPPPTSDWGSGGRSDVEARPSQPGGGGGLTSLGPGGGHRRSPSFGDRGFAPGAYMDMDLDYDGELYPGARLLRAPPVGDESRRQSSPPRDRRQQDHQHSQLISSSAPSPAAGGAFSPPRFGRWENDPGLHSSFRPFGSGMGVADSARPSFSFPGQAGAVAAAGDHAAGGRNILAFGSGGRSGGVGGGGAVGSAGAAGAARAAAADGRDREQLSLSDATAAASSTCTEVGCEDRPRFGYKDNKKPVYCATHRRVGMVDTRHPRCKAEKCTKQPSFGLEGDRRASYCAKHRKAGMTNVTSRRCQHLGCLRNPNFGFPGDRRATRCKGHRDLGMVDIVSRRCRDPSCMRRPLYNMSGLRPVFCREHKAPDMIDVISARCQETGCLRHPSFGYVSDMKARRCARHRLENMEGVKGRRHKCRRLPTSTPPSAELLP